MKQTIKPTNISYKNFKGDLKKLYLLDKLNNKYHWSLDNFSGKHIIKVVIFKQKIIGFIVYYIAEQIDILRIVVKRNYRQLGIATFIIKQLKKYRLNIILEVKEDNNAAINLYKKFGFIQISVRKNYYQNGSNAIIMQWINQIS